MEGEGRGGKGKELRGVRLRLVEVCLRKGGEVDSLPFDMIPCSFIVNPKPHWFVKREH